MELHWWQNDYFRPHPPALRPPPNLQPSRAMTQLVTLPWWVVAALVLLAAVAVLDRFLVPSVRWYLRRRLNKAIGQLNDRLQLQIQPFKLTRRRVMIDRLLSDPAVMQAMQTYATEEGVPPDVALEKAGVYAREIVPSFSVFAYFGFATRVARALSRMFYRVRLGFMDEDALSKVDPNSAVVFVMNHRSNMDYVLVTWMAAERSALSYAVGEWARVWPLQQLIRSMGAYFIRRKSRNSLYRKVLARYVQMATEGGVTQAVFPEGGLSLDGGLAPAKLGLLNYIVSDFDPNGPRDVVLVPVGLNYDRVMEDRVLTAAGEAGERRFRVSLRTALGFFFRQIWLRITRRFFRYGYACVSFGRPLSLRDFVQEFDGPADQMTEGLGQKIMTSIGAVVPVLPVPLVANAVLREGRPMSRLDLKAACHGLLTDLRDNGAHVHLPRGDEDYMVDVGLRSLTLRHLVEEKDGQFSANAKELRALRYYAASIGHLISPATDPR